MCPFTNGRLSCQLKYSRHTPLGAEFAARANMLGSTTYILLGSPGSVFSKQHNVINTFQIMRFISNVPVFVWYMISWGKSFVFELK